MKAPRSDVVFRRFMAGESVEDIALALLKPPPCENDVEIIESALRRAFAKNRKRRSR